MYEHVKTGCKHIPPSEQPLQFQSGYFLNKTRTFQLIGTLSTCHIQKPHWNKRMFFSSWLSDVQFG